MNWRGGASWQAVAGASGVRWISSSGNSSRGDPQDISKTSIRGRAFKDSCSEHSAETVRVFNVPPQEVKVLIGGNGKAFKAGSDGLMPWKGKEKGTINCQISMFAKDDETWKVAESGERGSGGNLRILAFISEVLIEDQPTVTTQMIFEAVPE